MKLNLGCADRVIRGYIGVDIAPPADQIVDLAGPWPWEDSSVDEVMAFDVIEHIRDCIHTIRGLFCDRCKERPYQPDIEANYARLITRAKPFDHPVRRHPLGRIHFMNELHRVLKPGARAIIETPNAARGVGYFQDPTHVSPWCMSTFKYFEHGSFAHTRLAKAYGITAAFRIIVMREEPSPAEGFGEQVWKIHAELETVK